MPVYEYKCKKCGHVKEKHSSLALRKKKFKEYCPGCKTRRTFKLIMSVGFFKI